MFHWELGQRWKSIAFHSIQRLFYVADSFANSLSVLDYNGQFVAKRFLGFHGDNKSFDNRPFNISHLTVDTINNLIFASDNRFSRIQVFRCDDISVFKQDTNNFFVREWSTKIPGKIDAINVNPITGLVYLTDSVNACISVFSTDGLFIHQWDVTPNAHRFSYPRATTATDDDTVFVSDWGTDYISVFRRDGTFLRKWFVKSPFDIIVSRRHHVYTTNLECIHVYDESGKFLYRIGRQYLHAPRAITLDFVSNTLFVCDSVCQTYRISAFAV